jgi:hypothetical protein
MTNLLDARAARIVASYRDSTPAERRLGRQWYPNALDAARAIDPDAPERAAGVIAALSPRERWSVNVRNAAQLIGWIDSDAGLEERPRLTFETQQRKAERIGYYEDALDVLRGPKERAFYKAIVGDPDAVVVDTWAYRIAEGDWRGRAPAPDVRLRDRTGGN